MWGSWPQVSDEAVLVDPEETPRNADPVASEPAAPERGMGKLEHPATCYLCTARCQTALACSRYVVPLCGNCTFRLTRAMEDSRYGELTQF